MITMNDIAARAGVSQATVSYVLNDKLEGRRVGESTRCRVLEAAAELGYRRNELARAMVTGRSHVIAFVVHSPQLQVVAHILAGVLDEADENDYFIKVVRWNREDLKPAIERCLALRVDGIVTFSMHAEHMAELHRETEQHGIALGAVYNTPVSVGCAQARTDEEQSMRLIVQHLHELGHRRIGVVTTYPDDLLSSWRMEGLHRAISDFGLALPDEAIGYDHYNHEDTASAVEGLMSVVAPPTAIICYRDSAALATMRTLRRMGRRVPDDVSVVGMGDMVMARVADPPLTTLELPLYEMGRSVIRDLIGLCGGGDSKTVNSVKLPSKLVIRESTSVVSSAA